MARLTLILTVLATLFALLGWGRIIVSMIRELRWRKQRAGKWVVLMALCLLPALAEANEARCNELGANCICSTSMDTTSITDSGDGQHFTLNDGASKPCGGFDGVADHSIASGSGQVFSGVTSGEDIDALPAGHSVTAVLRSNTTSGAFLGHKAAGGTPTARREIQFYKYWSSTYNAQSNTGGSCNANKLAQFGGPFIQGPMFTFEGGAWTIYDINTSLNSNQSVDCCNGPGPGNAQNGPSLAGLLGKWWRISIVTHNAGTTGAGTTWQMFIKNVTDDEPELEVLDTSQTMSGVGNDWTTTQTTGLHPTADIDTMTINMFRSTNGGTACTGFSSYSHFLYAAWDTDAGQRIGAAEEIEGGGGSFTPSIVMFIEWVPASVGILWHFRQAVLSGFIAVWMMGGAFLSLTTQKTKQITYNTTLTTLQGVTKLMEKVQR